MWRPDLRCRMSSRRLAGCVLAGAVALLGGRTARALLPPWLQHAVSGSAIEAALFRSMALPGADVPYPRPPAESVTELNKLVAGAPSEAELLRLRAHQEEQALDFAGAGRDWKAYAARASDHGAGLRDLAAFYGRRLAVQDQFATLLQLGTVAPGPADRRTAPAEQRSWKAFEEALVVANNQSFGPAAVEPLWHGWLARYPRQPTVYARAFTWELNQRRTTEAQAILTQFRTAFPADAVFPVKAAALLALQAGGAEAQGRALAVYDSAFSALWPQELLNSYFDLLASTHSTRRFVAEAQARLDKDPNDLQAATKLFAYYRHEGHPETALAVLARYRDGKEQRDPTGKNWTPDELHTLEQLADSAQAYEDAARYAFALYHLPGAVADGRPAREAGLAAMVGLLLDAPEQPIALGAGNLSMYRDIGTLDGGPGFWNGVLSLWLNGQDVQGNFAQQELKAQPYLHRAKAAALLALLDTEAPMDAQRPAFHAKLIEAYAQYGEDAAVLQAGESFLQSFPGAPERRDVALAMADADARRKDTTAEFAVYDRLLRELGAQTGNLPLSTAALAGPTASATAAATATPDDTAIPDTPATEPDANNSTGSEAFPDAGAVVATRPDASRALQLNTGEPAPEPNPAAAAYAEVLNRYLERLTASHQLPQALAVLRTELDRNPDDPKLYERLSTFLSQNNLSAQQEEVFRAAMARFQDRGWYNQLARFYLRQKRDGDYARLVRQVTDIFSGTELDAYFAEVRGGGPQLALELNLYAHKRFPHDQVFTQNLLAAYSSKPTRDDAAWERLLRQSWWQSPELRNEFFAFLSRTGKLQTELAALPAETNAATNPAAVQERAEAELWASHFEASVPLFDALAQSFPASAEVGTTAADLNRSQAWLDPAGPTPHITAAVAIEQRLLSTDSGNLDRLARIGDILADHANGTPASYAAAGAFWRLMPATAPGDPETYLQAATVFWDYFQFDQALGEIGEARTHFGDPALYGYEAGAILEGKRDMAGAVREYTAAALAGTSASGVLPHADRQIAAGMPVERDGNVDAASNPSTARLLTLARRADTATLVDSATAAQLGRNGSLQALQLRVAVLDAEHRAAGVRSLLLAAVQRAVTADAAADLAAYAQTRGEVAAHEAALSREADLTPDPVEKLQLRYALVQAYEGRKDLPDAERLVDATYRDNPRILGVVRATVDFDWRNKQQKQAVDVLVDAAHAAQPPLNQQFTAEAAAKANESGDPTRGRVLALGLLGADPYNAQYLALAAESYAKAGDLAGLEAFYRERLGAVQTPSMTPEQRRARTALLRKGLIPALTQAKDFSGAVDQYTALVSAYPEDSALIREAALYAAQHNQNEKLLGFYLLTVQASPRDARYFVALGETEALLGDADAALQVYAHAVALRPERSELFIAKAGLEERLGRYNEAVADYRRLYQLSYKDPQWMVAAAKTQARQGHAAEVVASLEAAFLRGAQSTPHDYFQVAGQLEEWNLLAEAQHYAEQGAAAAGADLLAGDEPRIGADDPAVYARALTRTRHTDEAFQTLQAALTAAGGSPSSPGVLSAQVRSQGLASVTDAEWRKSYVAARQTRAAGQFSSALNAIGEAVAQYATPEEHARFAAQLTAQRGAAGREEVLARWIPAAHAAGLGALEASWRAALFSAGGQQAGAQFSPLVQLQEARLAFAELGHTLQAYVEGHPRSPLRPQMVEDAVEAYGAAGNTPAQVQLLRLAWANDDGTVAPRNAYLRLLAHRAPDTLVSLAASKQEALANAATEAALDQPSPELALRAVAARGAGLGAIWQGNYTALAGLYVHGATPAVRAAFEGSLGLQATIGERLQSPPDAAQHLTGQPWFYLASRYGEWLLAQPAGVTSPDDVLAADLEGDNGAQQYLALAQTEAEGGRSEAALTDTTHALEVSPGSATALDARASLLWDMDRHAEAVAAWADALHALQTLQDNGRAPESFWTGFVRIASRVQQHSLYGQLKPAMDVTLRSYLSHNGTYRSNELLRAAYQAAPSPADGVAWMISLAAAAKAPVEVLGDLDSAAWLLPAAREQILQREVDLLRAASAATAQNSNGEPWRLPNARTKLLQLYVDDHHGAQALEVLQSLPAAARAESEVQALEIVASAQTGALPALLQRFDAEPNLIPATETMQRAAATLQRDHDAASARLVLEASFRRALAQHQVVSADFLDVAEVRLQTGDPAGAVTMLQALIANSEDVDADRDAAATLLEKNAHAAQAIAFLEPLARGVPWDPSFRVRLAEARLVAGPGGAPEAVRSLAAVAADSAALYAVRARAARDLGGAGTASTSTAGLGSAELTLFVAGTRPPASARQPFFVEARVAAAAGTKDPKVEAMLLREALAIAPYAPEAQRWREQAFVAQQRAGDFAGAEATLMSLLAQDNSYVPTDSSRDEIDANAGEDVVASPVTLPLPQRLNAGSPDQKAAFARKIGQVYAGFGDDVLAGQYLRYTLQLAPAGPEAATATQNLAALGKRARLARANAARRPVIGKQLDQPRVVRARLSEAPDVVPPGTEENDE